MSTFLTILWDVSPEIVNFLPVRWYGLLFGLAFILGQQIMSFTYRTEGLNQKELDVMLVYMIVGTILGARLGHCLFYEFDYYTQDFEHILEILQVWKGGLASHGGGIGLFVASWLFLREYKIKSYLWLVDRLALTVVIGGAFIRFGNFMNSEIIGIPTDSTIGVMFLEEPSTTVEGFWENSEVSFYRDDKREKYNDTLPLEPLVLQVNFEKPVNALKAEQDINALANYFNNKIASDRQHILIPSSTDYELSNGNKELRVKIYGIPRHAAQLYESISCVFIFIIVFGIYLKYKGRTPDGLILGVFSTLVFTLRFLYEFIKENQVDAENNMVLNIGQKLSIPLIIAGIALIIYAIVKDKRTVRTPEEQIKK